MRVIITGGSGLIGRALSADLVRDGHEVVVLSRRPDRVLTPPRGVRVEQWDGRTSNGWRSLAEGADVVVNLAGENIGAHRWTPERKRALVRSRLNAGQAVVDAVRSVEHKPRVVVQASGIGYYGPHGDELVGEKTPPGADFLSRLAAEWEDSTASVEVLGVRRVILRTGVVLTAAGGALPRMMLPFRFFVGGPIGSGRQWLPWIHIADEVAAIRFLIQNDPACGPFNLASPNPTTNSEFARSLGRELHRPAMVPAPAFAVRLLLGEMATVVLDGQRAVPESLLKLGFRFRFADPGAALRDLLGRKP
jgi:uncharacterized protein (TIGR01777 family)